MIAVQHSALDDRIFYKEARSLNKAGHKVTYLCSANSKGEILDMGGTPLNKKGELQLKINDIQIIAVPHSKSIFQKSLNKINQSTFFKTLIQHGITLKADDYHAHEPQSLYIAQKIEEETKCKIVYDAHEPWLNIPRKDRLLRSLLLPKLKYLIAANGITRGDLLFHNHNIKSEVILNCSVPELFIPQLKPEKFNTPIIVHEGSLWFDRGLKEIIEAIRMLKKEYPNILFKIVGETFNEEKDYLEQKIKAYQLENNIEVTGWLSYEKVGSALVDCSIGLITNTPVTSNTLAGPANKFFNYLTYGIATIAMDIPETTSLLNQTNSGITIQNRSTENLYQSIRMLLEDKALLKRYCNSAFEAYQKFNWGVEEKKLISFYENVVLNDTGLYIR